MSGLMTLTFYPFENHEYAILNRKSRKQALCCFEITRYYLQKGRRVLNESVSMIPI
ncbi:hypothetical protein [Turicibacter sanguinis]|uniref:hypothetical protein n=1 Tax=Turicibacter sanguinis TaxID=154288 RepID=UPI0012FA5A76|nr:hypothetical protein [Turicibacter sanguinis]